VARFDLYRLPRGSSTAGEHGALVVDVQSSHLDYLESRVVVPLRPRAEVKPVTELHPVLHVEGDLYVLMTHALAAVRRRDLGYPIANLAAHRDQITRALDILITGF
jgi:toxin CcdB